MVECVRAAIHKLNYTGPRPNRYTCWRARSPKLIQKSGWWEQPWRSKQRMRPLHPVRIMGTSARARSPALLLTSSTGGPGKQSSPCSFSVPANEHRFSVCNDACMEVRAFKATESAALCPVDRPEPHTP